ncbi:class I SAM-dependent DNA methyltransferase [Vibrio sp. E150_011]
MSINALYTDLSSYYDLMCADIDYHAQSYSVRRLHQIFGNGGTTHLDLACGTGPHVRHFIDFGYQSSGLDINQPMLDMAMMRCPEAEFSLQDMANFELAEPVDLITCFLYSIHYNGGLRQLEACIDHAFNALKKGGMFCFNVVDCLKIDNHSFVTHTTYHEGSALTFRSGWQYRGQGEQQSLLLSIEKTSEQKTQVWHDEHPMVALTIEELLSLLKRRFDVHVFEHDYEKIVPWDLHSGNALIVCVKA